MFNKTHINLFPKRKNTCKTFDLTLETLSNSKDVQIYRVKQSFLCISNAKTTTVFSKAFTSGSLRSTAAALEMSIEEIVLNGDSVIYRLEVLDLDRTTATIGLGM